MPKIAFVFLLSASLSAQVKLSNGVKLGSIGGGSGTVTTLSSGNLSPLFTTSVSNPTTTPALSFTLSTQTANTLFGAATTTPSWLTLPSCSGAANALTWTTGTGFGCNSILGGLALEQQVALPSGGQHVILYPTAVTPITGTCCASNTLSNTSGYFTYAPGGIGGGGTWGATWSGFTLPSYVLAANVTAVYAFATEAYLNGDNSSTPLVLANSCSGGSLFVGGSASVALQQFTSTTTLTGSTISSASCTFQWDRSATTPYTADFNIPNIGLIVYYTGTAPPTDTNTQVTPPLNLNTATNTLGIDPSVVGVAELVAGTNVSLSPSGGTGTVTINATGGISGLTSGYIPLAGSATTLTANSHLDDGVTTASTITSSEPIAIAGSTHGLTIPAGPATGGTAAKVVYASDLTNGYAEVNENNTGLARLCTASNGACAPTFPWSCQPGLGDGLNAIPAGTYAPVSCYNDTGQTVTLTGIKCFSDVSGGDTMNVSDSSSNALLTGAVTCTNAYAAGTQSAHTTLAAGAWLIFSYAADGAVHTTSWLITGTHP